MTLYETLIGELGTTAGNHRCMPLMEQACPAAKAASLRPQGAPCGGRHPPLLELRGAAGSAAAGLAGARLHCCEPGGWRAPGGGPGDLAGKKAGWVLDEGRLPELVKAAACTHAE